MFRRKKIMEYDSSRYNRKQYRLLKREIRNNYIDEDFFRRVADPKNSESKMLSLFVVYKLYRLTPDMIDYLLNVDESMALTIIHIAHAFTYGISGEEITKLLYDRIKSENEACNDIANYTKRYGRGLDKFLLRHAVFDVEEIDNGDKGTIQCLM